jgi:hypothetical protein
VHRLGIALLATAALLAAGCGSSSTGSSTTAVPGTAAPYRYTPGYATTGWTGLGAKLSDWESAHLRDTAGCSAGSCFGSKVQVGPSKSQYEYTTVETTPEGRVDGYTQALGGGEVTPGVAEHIALALFPHDTRVLDSFVEHSPTGSCKSINVKSKTLGRWFAARKVGDASGVISIDLHGDNENGESTYPGELSVASVGLGRASRGTNC